jgi:hypothetical protein
MAFRTLPLVALVLLGGVWGERMPRQLVMLASDALRCAAQALSAALLLSGEALVPETVPSRDLQEANALLGLTDNATSVLGPRSRVRSSRSSTRVGAWRSTSPHSSSAECSWR